MRRGGSFNNSYSQFGQDRWVVNLLRGKRNGFFLEMGAADGICISNTLLLEKEYGWTGILIEPTRSFEKLVKNRPNCITDNSCIASERKKVNLFEAYCPDLSEDALVMSTVKDDIDIQNGAKLNDKWMIVKRAYQKDTVPLQEVLLNYNAPKVINYFSLDVEGYEYEVLRNFPFGDYIFLCLGVERPSKELQKLLKDNGYVFVEKVFDWMYVHHSIGKFILARFFVLKLLRIFILELPKKIYRKIKAILFPEPQAN